MGRHPWRTGIRAIVLTCAILLALFSSCAGLPEDVSSGDLPAEKGRTSVEGFGLRLEIPGELTSTGEGSFKESNTGLRVLFTQSDHTVTAMTISRLKSKEGLREIADYLQKEWNGIQTVSYRFSDRSGRSCAQILADNRSGKLVCITLSGLPDDCDVKECLSTLTYTEEPSMGVSKSDPTPESMHSAGISPITGTFIQSWLYRNYTEERWKQEFDLMKEMGIEFIIMGDTLSIETGNPITDASQYAITAAYPSQNPNFRQGTDILTTLFEHCSAYGMKLYVGMGNTTQGWPYLNADTTGLKEVAAVFADAAEDLFNVYYDRFPETFAGFYFVPELYNSSEFDGQASRVRYADRLAAGLKPVFDRIHSISDLPFIFSPYVNMFGGGWVSKNTDNIALFWEEFLRRADFRDNDILCPQDSVGAGGNDLAGLAAVTEAYRKAVDGCGKKILLWSNAELFIQPTGKYFDNFDGYGGYWSTCTVDRMVEQFRIASLYVDRIVTFAFPHYLSPYNTTDGYLNAYRDYLRTGRVETEKPTPPDTFRTLKVKQGERYVLQIAWSGMYDNFGIHRVNIYRNGEFCNYRNSTRNEGSSSVKAEYPFVFVDTEFSFDEERETVYSFEAVDCAGNVSERVDLAVSASSVPNRVTLGPAYQGSDAVTEGLRRIDD